MTTTGANGWPLFTKPAGDLDELVMLYPEVKAAMDTVGDFPEGIFAQWHEADLEAIKACGVRDREEGHEARPILAELKRPDGTLRYEVVAGPRCYYACRGCAALRDEEKKEFGHGAIGVFADSSGGEMEKLRKSLGQLAAALTTVLAPMAERVAVLEAEKATRELAAPTDPEGVPASGGSK